MKKLFPFCFSLLLVFFSQAQKTADVTKFLGIDVDGSKTEMIRKLKAKGFKPSVENKEFLVGTFNGQKVRLLIGTYKDKVDRIMVADQDASELADVRARFNKLVHQFESSDKYMPPAVDFSIDKDEDMQYEMIANNKQYEAAFYQKPDLARIDTNAMIKAVYEQMLTKYTKEQLDNPPLELKEQIDADRKTLAGIYALDLISNKVVWFCIDEFNGLYYISIYYDNVYNMPDGEDL